MRTTPDLRAPRRATRRVVLVVVAVAVLVPVLASCGFLVKPRPYPKVKENPPTVVVKNAQATTTTAKPLTNMDPYGADTVPGGAPAPTTTVAGAPTATTAPTPEKDPGPEWAGSLGQIRDLPLTGDSEICRSAEDVLRFGSLAANVGSTRTSRQISLDAAQREELRAYLITVTGQGTRLLDLLVSADAVPASNSLGRAFAQFGDRVKVAPPGADLRVETMSFLTANKTQIGQMLGALTPRCGGRLLELALTTPTM